MNEAGQREGPRIVSIVLNVANVARSTAFFVDALGFEPLKSGTREGADFERLAGVPGGRQSFTRLQLGEQEIELVEFEQAGLPYPLPRAANDPWFQHFAIVVSDMAQAYERLCRQSHEPISIGGPQQLPPSTGSVIAYKFRDPDGHPLELSFIPSGYWADPANAPAAGALFLGIDHSAIAVTDVARSVAFYNEQLGFALASRGLNEGITQECLDGLTGAKVDIVVMEGPRGGPHLELLHYRSPQSRRRQKQFKLNAIPATRLLVEFPAFRASHENPSVSAGAALQGDRCVLMVDPDGHRVELCQSSADW